jgi:HEAT repeat protein
MDLRNRLLGGDRRSIGQVASVVESISRDPSQFAELVGLVEDADALVAMRAADALEKLTQDRPEWLVPFKSQLLGPWLDNEQQELRWHAVSLATRIPLSADEDRRVFAKIALFLEDKSKIVQVFSLQALYDLAVRQSDLRPRLQKILNHKVRTASPAVMKRIQQLTAKLEKQ